MSRPKLLLVIGSTRPGRLAPRVAAWFLSTVADHPAFDIELVDLAEVGLPLLDEPGNPARGDDYVNEHTGAWSRTVAAADAFVFVMPEYNNGYTAAMKNALDYLFFEWRDKAVGFVSYGGNLGGGTRAVQALKPVLLAVGATPIHQAVNIRARPVPSATNGRRGQAQISTSSQPWKAAAWSAHSGKSRRMETVG